MTTKQMINARDEMLHICKTIWSSRTPEQLEGCSNMLKTYIQKHGDENIGITLIELEIVRQTRLNGMFAKIGMAQQKLKETKGKQLDIKKGKIK